MPDYGYILNGWEDKEAHRYPMGKGKVPEYSYWCGKKLSYIEARKQIYAPIYAQYVTKTISFKRIKFLYDTQKTLILRDYDAYDHLAMGRTLKDVINDPNRKCGHAFILAMILTNVLEACINSPTKS